LINDKGLVSEGLSELEYKNQPTTVEHAPVVRLGGDKGFRTIKGTGNRGCGQSLVTNTLKYLMDQLEERILQIYQLKNAKRLQYRVDSTQRIENKNFIIYQKLYIQIIHDF